MRPTPDRRAVVLALFTLHLLAFAPGRAQAAEPTSVTIAGDLQSELGCAGDWDAACAASHLSFDANSEVWKGGPWSVPAGAWQYKAAIDDSWSENYGLHAAPGGANIPLNLAATTPVRFYYSHQTHWVTDSVGSVIATAVGSFQSELGCTGDWQAECLRSWLQDPDGDGTYTFETVALPAGSYEAKVAIDEGWTVNYGAGGVPGGANIPFTVAQTGQLIRFSFDATSHLLSISAGPIEHHHDNDVEWDGLGHDSRDLAYRQPFGAVPAATPIVLRFRTFQDDVTGVKLRVWDDAARTETIAGMALVASGTCLAEELAAERCDWWEARFTPTAPTTLYYRFIVSDGTSIAYYADDGMLDGGWGAATSALVDASYAITVYKPGFQPIAWLRDAIVYQIFPDRFANGRKDNDPSTAEPRYGYPPSALDQIVLKPWGELPEGYCRSYVLQPGESCTEAPRGRDYFGGDLKGIDQHLEDLRAIGVTTLYLNPIFEAASNHAYDTRDYYAIDHRFGTQKDWENLAKHAHSIGMRILLDGVFNHVSSDSPYFDRDHHFAALGACEATTSPYRSWFTFHTSSSGPCAGDATYDSWFGFDTLPVLDKTQAAVKSLFYAGTDPVATHWLRAGADGWRLDVMSDPAFPPGFWSEFRTKVKSAKADAPIVGELWKKGDVLPFVRGDLADTTMNYRFRNAVLGFLGTIDDKGFPDDGASRQPPSVLARKLASMREDYPDATWFTSLNLLDSHDTERALWSLTPGTANRESRELDEANLAVGKGRLRLAAVLQLTLPGAPTVYYGDEVGLTGATDPDCRRTVPWSKGSNGTLLGDLPLRAWYAKLGAIRAAQPVLRRGDLHLLLADDGTRTFAFSRGQGNALAIVAVNGGDADVPALAIPLPEGMRPDVAFTDALGGAHFTATGGVVALTLPASTAAILIADAGQDLTPPAAPANLRVTGEGDATVALQWNARSGAASYHVYRSILRGGGWTRVTSAPIQATAFQDAGLENAKIYYYVVTALDAAGNESADSNEVAALPHLTIGWANLQWPPSMTHTISAVNRTDTAYGQVWIDGVTSAPGATPTLRAQLGFGPAGTNPATAAGWAWVDASFNVDAGNNDEFRASLLPQSVGTFDYVYRYTTDAGRTWLYADLNGPVVPGASPPNPGKLTVNASGDTTAPAVPDNLRVVTPSPTSIGLAWDANVGDATLFGYEVLRGADAATLAVIALVTEAAYVDADVTAGATYSYAVRAVDLSWNRSGIGDVVTGTAAARPVTVTFTVTVPSTTDATGLAVNIAGTLSRLDGGLPDWNPAGQPLTRVDATHWTVQLTGLEGVQLEYKYALGSWTYVEKDAACAEIGNRQLTLTYGANGTQTVNDTVQNWRNVAPCGD